MDTNTLYVHRAGDKICLEFEVLSSFSRRSLFTVRLLELYSNEGDLNQGRFEKFTYDRQEYNVIVDMQVHSLQQLKHAMTSMIEWVAEHAEGAWSLAPYSHHVNFLSFGFSFENPTTAVVFSLCWK